jgi:hypothetical protein
LLTCSVPLKTTDEVDWINPLKQYIRQTYDDPEKFTEVCVSSTLWGVQSLISCRNVEFYRDYDRILAEQARITPEETCYTATTASWNYWTYVSQSMRTTSA